jgi:hypothetical protein
MDRMFDQVGQAGPQGQVFRNLIHKVVDRFDFMDYIIEVSHTDGYREISESFACIQPAARNKILARAVLDLQPIADPLQYVPANAVGFSVSEGVDWSLLYQLLQTIVTEDIPRGSEGWAYWEALLADIGLDMQRDVFSWLDKSMISISLPPGPTNLFGSSDWVGLLRVSDPELARQKINAMIDNGGRLLNERFGHQLMIEDEGGVDAEGFRSVTHPMIAGFLRPVIGVHGQWLMVGTSATAVNTVIRTAAGQSPNITSNERFQREGLPVTSVVSSASFADLSDMGEELGEAAMIFGIVKGFQSGMGAARDKGGPSMPAFFNLLERVLQVVAKIDFYSSMSTITTREENGWRSKSVITYKKPAALE